MDLELNPQSGVFTKIILAIDAIIEVQMSLNYSELIRYRINEEFLRLYFKDNFLTRIGEYCNKS